MAILSSPDLLVGAENRPLLESPKIDQITKAIALVFWISECISERNEIALFSTTWRGESSGDTSLLRSDRRS